jgi:hypothetical protein
VGKAVAGTVKSPSTVKALPSAIELFGTIDKLRSPPKRSALSTEIAAGYLPGAKYKTCPATGSCTSPIDNFAT